MGAVTGRKFNSKLSLNGVTNGNGKRFKSMNHSIDGSQSALYRISYTLFGRKSQRMSILSRVVTYAKDYNVAPNPIIHQADKTFTVLFATHAALERRKEEGNSVPLLRSFRLIAKNIRAKKMQFFGQ